MRKGGGNGTKLTIKRSKLSFGDGKGMFTTHGLTTLTLTGTVLGVKSDDAIRRTKVRVKTAFRKFSQVGGGGATPAASTPPPTSKPTHGHNSRQAKRTFHQL